MDFQADLRRFALEQLEHYGVKYRKKDDLTTLLIKLYTFFEKYIVPREREVLMARELEEKLPRLPPLRPGGPGQAGGVGTRRRGRELLSKQGAVWPGKPGLSEYAVWHRPPAPVRKGDRH